MQKKPKDLGVKIGTPTEVLWTAVKKTCEADIISAKNCIEVNTEMLRNAERIIAIEKKKFK